MSNEKHLTANLENTPLGGVKTAKAKTQFGLPWFTL